MQTTRSSRVRFVTLIAAVSLLPVMIALGPACSSGTDAPQAGTSADLVGSWVLTELPGATGIDLAAVERAPRLEVGAEGQVSGFAGVNRFNGQFDLATLEQGRLASGPMISTKMAGPPAAMELEAAFLQALSTAGSYGFEGDVLVLSCDGAPVARLSAER